MAKLYICTQSDEYGDELEDEAHVTLIWASTEERAKKIAAVYSDPPHSAVVASKRWRNSPMLPAVPDFSGIWEGAWLPPDVVYAGYGIVPNEEWCICAACDNILHEDDFADGEDECNDCTDILLNALGGLNETRST